MGLSYEDPALRPGALQRAAATFLFCLALLLATDASSAAAATATWSSPGLDKWFYSNVQTGAGTRFNGPTWIGGLTVNEQSSQFEPHPSTSPAQHGMSVVAFNTSANGTNAFPPSGAHLDSVVVTFTMEDGTGHELLYDDTVDTQPEIIADFVSGNYDTARPMEMYGVGFRAPYTGFEFTSAAVGPPLMDELPASSTYFAGGGGYTAYPISVGDDGYVDVSNSITGGYSATAPDNFTDPFTAEPFAIGKNAALNPGDVIPDDTTFTFALDLSVPGVREYVEQSLTTGALGFFFSSSHLTGEFGAGGGYPQWYMKEAVGGIPSTLTIDYTIQSPSIPADYDRNGHVEVADYAQWKLDFGKTVAAAGDGADGNGDGIVDAADYTFWRDRFNGATGFALPLLTRCRNQRRSQRVPGPSAYSARVDGDAFAGGPRKPSRPPAALAPVVGPRSR